MDGSCRNDDDNGRTMKPYKRLVPPDYCSPNGNQNIRLDNPRCAQSGNPLPNERQISLQMRVNFMNNGGFGLAFSDGVMVSNAFTGSVQKSRLILVMILGK